MSHLSVPIVEDGVPALVSLYAEQKVAIEWSLLFEHATAACSRRAMRACASQCTPANAARGAPRARELTVESVGGRVFNVGRSAESHRKLDVVEIIREQTDRGTVSFIYSDEDPFAAR